MSGNKPNNARWQDAKIKPTWETHEVWVETMPHDYLYFLREKALQKNLPIDPCIDFLKAIGLHVVKPSNPSLDFIEQVENKVFQVALDFIHTNKEMAAMLKDFVVDTEKGQDKKKQSITTMKTSGSLLRRLLRGGLAGVRKNSDKQQSGKPKQSSSP